jgi:phenylpyruvate tautomerase PptA (4-oxalocrotonate tautomerase family)
MPLLKLQVSVHIDDAKRADLLKELSRIVAKGIGKPEKYVMVTIDQGAAIMSGEIGDAAFADVRSIGGLDSRVNKALSSNICGLLKDALGIPGDRVYVNFTNVEGGNWGCNGSTFG